MIPHSRCQEDIIKEEECIEKIEAKKNRDWQELMYRMFGTSSAKDKEAREKIAAAAKEKEEKEKVEKENAEFQSRLLEIFK